MNLICYLQTHITVDPASWIPTATWLLVDNVHSDDIFPTIFVEVFSDIVWKLVVAIRIMPNQLAIDKDLRIHVDTIKCEANIFIKVFFV